MPLENAKPETSLQHIDALNILVHLILTEMAQSAPQSLVKIIEKLADIMESDSQMDPKLLEDRISTYAALRPRQSGALSSS